MESKSPIAELLNIQGGSPGKERISVYANGYIARLHEALGEVYPVIHRLLGEERFVELAENYAAKHPSQDYNLTHIGCHLPDFLRGHEFSRNNGFLPELAQLEWLLSKAFHAFDEPLNNLTVFASLDAERMQEVLLHFQPSVSLLRAQWPVLDVWNSAQNTMSGLHFKQKEQFILVYREGLDPKCQEIESVQYELLKGLTEGKTLGEACESLTVGDTLPPLDQWFSNWGKQGLLTGFSYSSQIVGK